MVVIQATEAHVPAIIEVWKEFMAFHADFDLRFPITPDAHVNMEKHLRELMTSSDNLVLIAEDGNRVVGYSIAIIAQRNPMFVKRTYGDISDMAVTKTYRRRGAGEQMLSQIIEWFKLKNVRRIELSVVSNNPIGYPFWRKHGFKDYMHRLYLDAK